ncbi:MAG: hypothetical protein H7Y12_03565 [Sphingobacteriaceae bacterium]|nr:hypothetical protein [Cytophagaceae bacterium]
MNRTQKLNGLALALLVFGNATFGLAQTAKEVFNSSEPITYLGVDFSDVKFLGESAADVDAIKNKWFAAINDVVVNEPKKYDLKKAFQKSDVPSDLSFVTAKNATADASKIISFKSEDYSRFTPATIASKVKEYNFGGKKGVGLLFITEAWNKNTKEASMYVTLLDMGSRRVIFTERMTGSGRGFGFRNFWVHPVLDVIEQIERRKLKEWKAR